MGIIISIENPKGGSGKTTSSINLARALQLEGNAVLIVDRNPDQPGSIKDCREDCGRDDYPMVVYCDTTTLHNDIKKISSQFDFVIIDGASKLQDKLASSVKASDLMIIPVQPSKLDVEGCKDLVTLIKERQTITDGKPKAVFLISREKKHTHLARGIREALADYDIPVLNKTISDSVTYAEASGHGLSVFDLTSKEAKAKSEEIRAVLIEIKELLSA